MKCFHSDCMRQRTNSSSDGFEKEKLQPRPEIMKAINEWEGGDREGV